MRDLPTGTVTFLFTDVEGSTRLLADLGEAYGEALAEHRRVVREAVARHGGVEVDTQGDSFFCAFSRASDAVVAAQEIASDGGPLRVRLGLHTGEPTVTDEGYVGRDVHVAARVCAAAHGGQVLASARTQALLDDAGDGLQLADLGRHVLKDVGEVRLYQIGGATFPPPRTLNAKNVPIPATPLLGRKKEVAHVLRLLRGDARLVTVTGPGGVGKTRFALEVASELVEDFADGVSFVDLSALRDPDLVLPTIAGALGANVDLAERVADRHVALVLDNLEQVVAAAPELGRILERCPNVRLLVTSREPLRLRGEREVPLLPLAEQPAVALFRDRAEAIDPFFDAPDELLADICRRLDHLPLAIELAAARTRTLTAEQLLERLGERLPLLRTRSADVPERQRTLRATIEWSYELLSADEQPLFRRLAVFAGGFTFEAAEVVCEANVDTLDSLVAKGLVQRQGERFAMLETVREFAAEQLALADGSDVLRRHAAFYLALTEAALEPLDAGGAERRAWLERLAPERENARAALRWSIETSASDLALSLAAALHPLGVSPVERLRWLEETLQRVPDGAPDARTTALRSAGWAAIFAGEFPPAADYFEHALALCRELADEFGQADAMVGLAYVRRAQAAPAAARSLMEAAIELFRHVGKDEAVRRAFGDLGEVETDLGNFERARELLEQSLELAERSAATSHIANITHGLGDLALAMGDADAAVRRYTESLALVRDHAYGATTCYCLAGLAAARAAERPETASLFWRATERLERDLGFRIAPFHRARYERLLRAGGVPDSGGPAGDDDVARALELALQSLD